VDLTLAPGWLIPKRDLVVRYVHSSGPGGQNVNKLATKVELRLLLLQTAALNEAQKRRLAKAFPSHVTGQGDFLLTSDRFRSQRRNQSDAFERLAEMILSVRRPPAPRIKTKPTRASKQRRLTAKRQQSERKQQRRNQDD
jgi:ribosome-associated protein